VGFKAGLELAVDSDHWWAHPLASNNGSALEITILKTVFEIISFCLSLRTQLLRANLKLLREAACRNKAIPPHT